MDIGLLMITSARDTNNASLVAYNETFIKSISALMKSHTLSLVGVDTFKTQPITIFLVASGGSEQFFRQYYRNVTGPYFLVSTKKHNSLAASMEILAFLQEQGLSGQILHGTEKELAVTLERLIQVFTVKNNISSFRLGCIGKPHKLLASDADPVILKDRCGMELIDIPMEALFAEIDKKYYEGNAFTQALIAKEYDAEELEKALFVYGAVRRLVNTYGLQGVTVRCFDLLEPYKITGCLALAILNAQGIYAACEGDTRSLLSMVILGELSGNPIFMANPSSIDTETNSLVFAHCMLPLSMPDSYELTTHYESGLGVSIRGKLQKGPYTIFKCKEDMHTYFVQKAILEENLSEAMLCRTQVLLHSDNSHYYLENPIANHHLLCAGDQTALVQEFFRWI